MNEALQYYKNKFNEIIDNVNDTRKYIIKHTTKI